MDSMKLKLRRLAGLMLLVILAPYVQAQNLNELRQSNLNTAAFYNYSEPGDVTIFVHGWGALRFPGLYEVPRGTNLRQMFSLAGGPQLGMRTKRSQRRLKVSLMREVNGVPEVLYSVEMVNEIQGLEQEFELHSGDIIVVEAVDRARLSWRDIFPIVGSIASVAVAIERLTN